MASKVKSSCYKPPPPPVQFLSIKVGSCTQDFTVDLSINILELNLTSKKEEVNHFRLWTFSHLKCELQKKSNIFVRVLRVNYDFAFCIFELVLVHEWKAIVHIFFGIFVILTNTQSQIFTSFLQWTPIIFFKTTSL